MAQFKTLDDANLEGKKVLIRADLNVPMKDGAITDTTRIDRVVPTVKEMVEKGAKVIIISHFGRPKGKKEPSMSLEPISAAFGKALGQDVKFIGNCIGDEPKKAAEEMQNGEVIMLENLRYYNQETDNDMEFAKEIASFGDVYVNDAFSTAHRAHASTHGIATLLPAYAGRLMEAELNALGAALESPVRPVVAVVGGSKISTKLELLNNLVQKIDVLVLGGGMANTFLFANGVNVGKSLCEEDMKEQALEITKTAEANNCKIVLPVDAACADKLESGVKANTISVNEIPADQMMLDIGPDSVKLIEAELQNAKTLLWNGPVGAFEFSPFDKSSVAIAKIVSDLTSKGDLTSVAGGGDTVAALGHAKCTEKMTYVSTAGGAFLEWLEGKELPGVKALQDAALSNAA